MRGQPQQAPRGGGAAAALDCQGGKDGYKDCGCGTIPDAPESAQRKRDKFRFLTSQVKSPYDNQRTSMTALTILLLPLPARVDRAENQTQGLVVQSTESQSQLNSQAVFLM